MANPNAFARIMTNPAVRSSYLKVKDLQVEMHPFRHDLATCVIGGVDDTDPTMWNSMTPVIIDYGSAPSAVNRFVGYILGTDREWTQQVQYNPGSRDFTAYCIGASTMLKDGLAAAYSGMSLDQIVTALTTANYFDVDCPADPYIFPSRYSAGMSTWEFLCDLAKSRGRVLYVSGCQLRCYDPLTELARQDSVVPVFYDRVGYATNDPTVVSTILNFETDSSFLSSTDGRRQRIRELNSIPGGPGAPIQSVTNGSEFAGRLGAQWPAPVFRDYVTDIIADTQADADALLVGKAAENRFAVRAKALLNGDNRVTQASPVVLEGLGVKDSGIWQVLSVMHHVKYNAYTLEAELGRDSTYDTGARPGLPAGVSRPYIAGDASTPISPPPPALVNGRWRSAYSTQAVANA